MKQKIIKVGNSAAVTLPKEFLRQKQRNMGDRSMRVKDEALSSITTVAPEFKKWLDAISIKYEEAIKELARR
ncbi:MAG TPA: AbrB/MazE/SpoVT family DNA-binding domain-containing protein [Patescibacteria group bacterium]|nr:AbrB/MazE/SpoVT family DNA-binding domain-containing protein [Patescibacteria group bacterium]